MDLIQKQETGGISSFLQDAVLHSRNGVAGFDFQLKINFWNDALEIITGKPRERVFDLKIDEALPFLTRGGNKSCLADVLQGLTVEFSSDAIDPVQVPERTDYRIILLPVRNEDGEVFGGLLHVSEVTAKHRKIGRDLETEEIKIISPYAREIEEVSLKLEQTIREFRFVNDFMPQMVWATQPDGYHDFYNKRWYEFTGLTYEETKDKGWSLVLHPDDYERTWEVWKRSLETGNLYEIEYRMRKYDGTYKWFLARALPLKDKDGQIVKWFGTCTDIEEQRKTLEELSSTKEMLNTANEELRVKNKELERVNVELDNFVYTVSHDLKAPLNNIEGLLSLLNTEDEDTEKQKVFLSMITKEFERFKGIVSELSIIARSSKSSPDQKEINLPALIREIEEDLQDEYSSANAVFLHNFKITFLKYSRKDLRSILYNLLSNAVRYRSPDRSPEIKITTRVEDEFVILEVADNGIGIKEQDIPKIFQKYLRLHTHVEGTGIGMFILKRMVENSGGRIEVESTEGKGSIFRIFLKAKAENY